MHWGTKQCGTGLKVSTAKIRVIAAHMEETINLHTVKGSNYEKVLEFCESLSKNFDALQTLEEENMLKGLVMSILI